MWCLPTTVHKDWCAGHYYRNDKESHTFQWCKPLILQYDIDTNIFIHIYQVFQRFNEQFYCMKRIFLNVIDEYIFMNVPELLNDW